MTTEQISLKPIAAAAASFIAAKKARDAADALKDIKAAKEENRRAYIAVSAACLAHAKQFYVHNLVEEHFPPDLAIFLHGLLENLIAGHVDQSLKDLLERGPGTQPRHYIEAKDIEAACRYVQACRAKPKLIDDRAPIKTILGWYRVQHATAQGWVRNTNGLDLLADFPKSWTAADKAAAIVKRAQQGGRRVAMHGRGQQAVTMRAKKRL